ncbi:kinase-like protein [Coprinellus micaceus]|uniref:non-specific serine/threonine protein kinase n=1 Tax=Coprinellus micaceus TaxID=71717 RepID=A0A4Y7T5A0_COPMI|nr:kinase-like protein [Coprinellus micaceus]
MRVHSALKHENVLEFLNAVVVELKHGKTYYPGIYMLLGARCRRDLFDKIAPDKGVSDDLAHYYFGQLTSGISYIHAQGVCHRDLKPENLLLDIKGTLKISDFGLSAVYKLKESGENALPYVAPELASDSPYNAEPVDVWGCGVILFTLLVGNTPWDEPTMKSGEFVRYVNGSIFGEQPWCRIGETALDLLRGMLTPNPANRFTLQDVLAHEWCVRPSQLQRASPGELADRLTQELRESGDMDLAAPRWGAGGGSDDTVRQDDSMDTDEDDATHQSQFTQSLLLFSQTSSGGSRYIGSLTRFYASLRPARLAPIIQASLETLGVKVKVAVVPPPEVGADETAYEDLGDDDRERRRKKEKVRLRIGGYDSRRVVFKGWVEVEYFRREGMGVGMGRGWEGSFVVFSRDEGDPISWRRMWKEVVKSEGVLEWVLRKG